MVCKYFAFASLTAGSQNVADFHLRTVQQNKFILVFLNGCLILRLRIYVRLFLVIPLINGHGIIDVRQKTAQHHHQRKADGQGDAQGRFVQNVAHGLGRGETLLLSSVHSPLMIRDLL